MRVVLPLSVCALLLAVGCGKEKGPVPVHPVSGKIVYGGKPAAGVRVFLYPTSAPIVPEIPKNPSGVTGSDGRFAISTYEADDGAAEGGYQIVLLWPPPPDKSGDTEESDTDRLLGWYDAAHSRLTAQIKSGANDLKTISLSPVSSAPAASEGVPGRN